MTRAGATNLPAFVFAPQLERGVDPALGALVRDEAGATLNEWCASTGDPMLAAELQCFLASGDTQRLWLQSATTGVQIALAEVLRQRGLEPAAAAGIGMGELAAAVAAGRTSVGDATRVARAVSVLFAAGAGEGRMVTVATNRTSLARVLGEDGPALAISLAPRLQVIAGRCEDVERVSLTLRAMGIEVRELHLPSAFHSTVVEALHEPFLRQLGPLALRWGRARLYSGIDASPNPLLDAEHWWEVCRRPFHFDDAIRSMLVHRVRWFIEVGPRSAVADHILAIAASLGVSVRVDAAHELLIEAQRSPRRVTGT